MLVIPMVLVLPGVIFFTVAGVGLCSVFELNQQRVDNREMVLLFLGSSYVESMLFLLLLLAC